MTQLIAFDVYGTLIDTHGVVEALSNHLGNEAMAFSNLWRDKQLEYAFRKGLMRQYQTFADCTRQALDYCCARFASPLSNEEKQALMGLYGKLPAFDDASAALKELKGQGRTLVAFSNGTHKAVESLMKHSGLMAHLDGIISVDDLKTFKPNPDVYQYLRKTCGTKAKNSWLVSGNPFDVIGARAAELQAVWVKRSPTAVFDPWDYQPTATISELGQLRDVVPSP